MESIIIVIIMMILGSVFGSKGKQKQAPPKRTLENEQRPVQRKQTTTVQTTREQPTAAKPFDPVRKFKDLSKELLDEIEREFANPPEEPPSRQTEPIVEPKKPVKKKFEAAPEVIPLDVQATETRRSRTKEPHQGRLSAHGGEGYSNKALEKEQLIPTNRQELIQGILFSEILGPPKSKQ